MCPVEALGAKREEILELTSGAWGSWDLGEFGRQRVRMRAPSDHTYVHGHLCVSDYTRRRSGLWEGGEHCVDNVQRGIFGLAWQWTRSPEANCAVHLTFQRKGGLPVAS